MFKSNKLLSLIFFFICFAGSAFSQTVIVKPLDFISTDGGFQVNLPANAYRFSLIETGEGFATKGNQFTWDDPTGFYKLTFADLLNELENPKDFLEISSGLLTENAIVGGGKLLSEKELSLDGNPGLETRIELKSGTIAINRNYIVKKRLYTLFSGWKKGESGKAQLKILDSFRLYNPKKS